MKTYRVEWAIDLDAEDHEAAARAARKIQLDPASTATVFNVSEFDVDDGEYELIDLDALDQKLEEDYLNDPRQ